jgi:serine/threonine protein kinase
VHRDLKTENVFIWKFPENGEDIKVKIGDLGFCVAVKDLEKLKEAGKTVDNVGSPIYMSP